MNAAYTPKRPVLRIVFIAIAGIATLSTGVAIDGLALHYASNAVAPLAPATPTMLATAPR